MKTVISSLSAIEILDSRGNPTVRVFCTLSNGVVVSSSVPSGASTGENEAVELRDGDKKRYNGKGVLKAVDNVNNIIAPKIIGMDPFRQAEIDRVMIELDGTPNKGRLGANAILGVSMAVAQAGAKVAGLPLYQYLGGVGAVRLPVPMMNILNGGKHAENSVDLQEFMVMPIGAQSFAEALRYGAETFHSLKKILSEKGYSTGVGYEGAFSPREIKSNKEALDIIIEGIQKAGYTEKFDMALDIASSELFNNDTQRYELKRENKSVNAQEWISLQSEWYSQYPVFSIEDPLNENSWEQWSTFTKSFGDKYQIVGDDLLVTNTKLIQKGINEKAMNAVLIKLNQIGTVSETLDAIKMSVNNGMQAIVSHRSGETNDSFIADIVVGTAAQQSKFGAVTRGERVVKYNRLLEIEEYLL